ncbi:MAG TPA: hypothetical protein VK395_03005 [Gemmataceae bacterium]|nr:hypothetical protein [Gemmataceae bacterium]
MTACRGSLQEGDFMCLVELDLPAHSTELPRSVQSLLKEADRRIQRFQRDCRVPGFVPSDFAKAYAALRGLAAAELAPGNIFCEWGSGFGVVTCIAAMLDFDAYGIEIEGELVEASRQLAEDFGLSAEFVRGSFIPSGGEVILRGNDGFSWLSTEAGTAHDELGMGPDDFDLIFAYPWPDEEHLMLRLFDRYARAGAVLLTYRADDSLQAHRKLNGRSKRR